MKNSHPSRMSTRSQPPSIRSLSNTKMFQAVTHAVQLINLS